MRAGTGGAHKARRDRRFVPELVLARCDLRDAIRQCSADEVRLAVTIRLHKEMLQLRLRSGAAYSGGIHIFVERFSACESAHELGLRTRQAIELFEIGGAKHNVPRAVADEDERAR